MKNVLDALAQSVLVTLGLTAAATDGAIQKKVFGSGITTLIFSNEEINDIIKIIKSLEKPDLLIKVLAKQLKTN